MAKEGSTPDFSQKSEIRTSRKILFTVVIFLFFMLPVLGIMEVALRTKTPLELEQRLRKLEVDELQATGARSKRRRKFNTMYQDSPKIGYRLATNFDYNWQDPEYNMKVKTNSLGMRERELTESLDGLRILTLGDSFVFGLGVNREETFHTSLEERMKAALSKPVEVLNSGVPGYGTAQQLETLKDLAPKLTPNLVLVCFYVGNDLIDNLHTLDSGITSERVIDGVFVSAKRYHIKDDELDIQNSQNRSLIMQLLYSTYTYNYLDMKVSGLKGQLGLKPQTKTLYKSIYKFHRKVDSEQEQRVYKYTRELLDEIKAVAAKQSTKVAIAIFPSQIQLRDDQLREQLEGFKLSADEVIVDKPNRRIVSIAEELKIPVIDLYKPFRQAGKKEYYYEHDGHWTAEGHKFAADILYDFLLQIMTEEQEAGRR
ncbi:MAG: SGNH/GDSL hydrolase family protein [Blastocatellia bacterium]|nr:SGNH/GDSL hydrolase family protein [Blastocatellia bacterium]